MLVRSLLIATMTLATPTLAAEQMAKSGSFITASSFKGIEQAQQTGGHTLSHGVGGHFCRASCIARCACWGSSLHLSPLGATTRSRGRMPPARNFRVPLRRHRAPRLPCHAALPAEPLCRVRCTIISRPPHRHPWSRRRGAALSRTIRRLTT
jgi:hypothetical protein